MKIFTLALAVAMAVFVIGGAAQPSTWSVSRSLDVSAAPEKVLAVAGDLHTWKDWLGYAALDPQASWDYGGGDGTPGAWMSWSGPRIGHGRLTLTKVDAHGLSFDERIESEKPNASGTLSVDGKHVTFEETGTLKPVFGGWMRRFIEKARGDTVAHGLAKLAERARG